MATYGLWTEEGGGFCEGPFFFEAEAQSRIEEDRIDIEADLSVVEYCPDHDEQPIDACEICEDE